MYCYCSSVAQSCPTLQPHWLQHTRLPCLSLSPRGCSNSCPLNRWCHPTISSSVTLFSCPQSFPASRTFQMSQLFISGGQSIGASVSASVLPMNIQSWFPIGWTGLISLQSRDSQESSPASQFESITSSALSLLYGPTLTSVHDYWKNHSFDYMDLCLLFNMLSRFVIAFLLRSKHLLISWVQSLSPMILEPKKIKSVTVSFSSSIGLEVMEPDTMIFIFWMLSFKPAFSLSFRLF